MSNNNEITVTAKFVSYTEKAKNGKSYLRVSDGLETEMFATTIQPDDVQHLSKGDECEVTISVNPFNSFDNKIIEIN